MTRAEEYEALVEASAKAIYAVIPNGGPVLEQTTSTTQDGRPVYRRRRLDDPWEQAEDRHDGCRELARAVLAVIAEKAKEWPTAEMMERAGFGSYGPTEAWRKRDFRALHFRDLISASPLVKPEPASNP